ncbi:hypothetical protein A1O3_00895 [Capronia epimyces CBS 606.96]|uniref:Uncharacterized protein n=1 Tax=Capronia epimyces CBS 606.96 TaxID=1182542 RepID=W9YRU0_9EURO|nr:uncharacterized protein A1O3_00895 [Capronia epimyces CBS 606.96]EXJ92345.1 hypothetical protein A1O3_00895 [Capronia epimyces CBS 606.96]
MGDVIESFLTHPDPERFGGCLDGKENLLDNHGQLKKKQSPGARPWKNAYKITWLRKFQATPSDSEKQLQRSRRWYQSASIGRWCWTVIPYIIVVGSGIYFLVTSLTTVAGRAGSRTYAFSMTWGAADQNALGLLNMNITSRQPALTKREHVSNLLFPGSSPTLRNSIIMFANMWHWLLSLLYIQCNSVLTCMCAEAEWQSYARKRKSLRVTTPRGLQRSTYFVSVPMRYGLAFQLAFPVLHWTLSQGVFLVVIQGFWQGSAEYEGTNNLPFLAFSFWPIFTSILIGISILSVLVTVSLKRHANIMPMGATCSAVISAACHPPAEDVEAHLFPVQWGRVPPRAKSLAKLADTENPSGSDEVDTTLAQHHVTSNPPEPQHLEITSQSGQSQSVKGHHYELVPPSASRDDQNLQGSDIDSTAEEQQQHSGREEDVPLMMQVSPSQRSMVKPPSCTTTEIRTPAQDNMRHYTFTTYAHVECATSEEKYPDLYLKHDCEYH